VRDDLLDVRDVEFLERGGREICRCR